MEGQMVQGSDMLEQVWLSPGMANTCAGLLQLKLGWSCLMRNSPPGGVQADEQHLQKGHLAWPAGT